MRRLREWVWLAGLLLAVRPGTALAQAPLGTAFTYQGRLTDGTPPANGSYDLQFRLFGDASGGTPVGEATVEDVSVSGGLFTVTLDFGAGAFAGSARWLEIGVRPGASPGAFTTLSPRQELTPAPSALFSSAASWSGLQGVPEGFADGIDDDGGGDVTAVNTPAGSGLQGGVAAGEANLAIMFGGTGTAPQVARSDHQHFGATWAGATATHGLKVVTSGNGRAGWFESDLGQGVFGWTTSPTGITFGVRGETASSGGRGVHGAVTATTGLNYGVLGSSLSTNGRGVLGQALATTGPAFGVIGESLSDAGRGVWGLARATTGLTFGAFGESASTNGYGVYGLATATAGSAVGVEGTSFAPDGRGVTGFATSGSGIGVTGHADEDGGIGSGVGVWGASRSSAGVGVYGTATATTGTNYAVRGQTDSPEGYAGYFVGRAHVTGTLSKGGGAFKIDHPLDPENKYLYHSFVESPDMMNVYNGTVTTDARGYATVDLPEWFEALNREFRYQLTVIDGGDEWAFAKVVRKVEGNRFTLRTSAPRVEVSWQVTGVRRDPFAEKHRIPVEEDKPESQRGTYLHPEAWGQRKERGLDHEHTPQVRPRIRTVPRDANP